MATAVAAYFSLITTLGLPTIGIREVARNPNASHHVWQKVAILRLVLALGSYGALAAASVLLPSLRHMRELLLLYGLGLFLSAVSPDWVFIGLERMAVPAMATVLGGATSLGLMLILVKSQEDMYHVPLAVLAGSAFSLTWLVAQLVRHTPKLLVWGDVSSRQLAELLRSALPFLFVSVASQLYGNADLIVLGLTHGSVEAGLYAAAYRVINALTAIVGLISQATYPAMARALVWGREAGIRYVARVAVATLAIFLPIAAGGSIIAPDLVSYLLGNEYVDAAWPLTILLWYVLLSGLSISVSNALLASNRDRVYITAVTMGAVVDLGLVVVLVPRLASVGAAIAMVLAEGCILAFLLREARLRLKVSLPSWRSIGTVAISTAVMAGVVHFVKSRMALPAVVTAGVLSYGLVLAAMMLLFRVDHTSTS